MIITNVFLSFYESRFELYKLAETSKYFVEYSQNKEEFLKTLTEEQIKTFKHLVWLLDMHYDEIYYEYSNKACNYGVRTGMQIQEALEEMRDY